MTRNKAKITLGASFIGEYYPIGKEILTFLNKFGRKKGIGETSPRATKIRDYIIAGYKAETGQPQLEEGKPETFHAESYQPIYPESLDIIVDTEKDPIKEGLDEFCYFIVGKGWFSSINRHGLKLGIKNGIPNFIPHPIVIQQWKAHQTEKIFLKTIFGKKKLTKEDIEQLNDNLRASLIIQEERGWINNPELKKEAQTIIEKKAYGYMQSEIRKYDEDRKKLIEEKWNLEEELKSLKETDLGELLEKEQKMNANLESQLKDNKAKIEKLSDQIKSLLSENESLKPYKNENFNLKQQISDLHKELDAKLEPQSIEKEVIKEVLIENPLNNELKERVKKLEVETREAKKEAEDWWFCYNLSGGDPKTFQTLAREKFPQRFASDIYAHAT